MKKLFTLSLVLCCMIAIAQQNPPTAPQTRTSRLGFPVFGLNAVPITGASIQLVGPPGQATWYYWAVANYQIGSVVSLVGTVTNAPNTLSVSNYVQIFPIYPIPITGISVDILKTSTPLEPSGACNCAVATGLISGVVNDQSNSTSSYTLATFDPSSFRLWMTNEVVGSGITHLLVRNEAGALVADISAAGSGSGTPDFMFGAGNFSIAGILNVTDGAVADDLALRVYAIKFSSPFTLSFSRLSLTAASNLAGGGNINIGFYDETATTLLYQTGAIAIPNAANFDVDLTLNPVWTLSPGTYYLAWTATDAGNTAMWGWSMTSFTYNSGTSSRNLINRNGTVNYGYSPNAATAGAASLPASLGSLNTVSSTNATGHPAILFQR